MREIQICSLLILSQRQLLPSCLSSSCVLRTGLGNYHIGSFKNISKCNWALYCICSSGPTDCCPLSEHLSLSFFCLSLGEALELGRVVSSAPSLKMSIVCSWLFRTTRNIYHFSLLKLDEILKDFFVRLFK